MAEISELSAARAAATRTDARVLREQQEQTRQLREQQERDHRLRLTEQRESELDQRVQQDIDIRLAEDQIATAEANTDLPRGSIVDILG